MKNKNNFFWGISSSVFFVIGTMLMMFSNFLISGAILLVIGLFTALRVLNNKRRFYFADNFLVISVLLGLVILVYIFMIDYSSNLVIISSSFYALNFLIQINNVEKKKRVVKKFSDNQKLVREKISELKKSVKELKDYFYTESGKSFHLGGCIALSRTKQENLKKSNSRQDLINKGYKSCKACNS
ncbi:hypothetical protein KO361_01345 [Candidatus Woesearchaeota archaeon]|nr:hypothetical protein [Candidatus Woesearchaeota archaeon]